MKHYHAIAAAGLILGTTAFAPASEVGLDSNPPGNQWTRGDTDTAYAVWNTFSFYTYTAHTPTASSGFADIAHAQSKVPTGNFILDQGAGVYANVGTRTSGDDVLYTGNIGASFDIAGTTDFDINKFYLQVKRASSDADFSTAITPLLNGIPATSVSAVSGDGDMETSTNGLWSVTTWYWDLSEVGTVTSFNVVFDVPSHRGIDAIVVDAAVPEPGMLSAFGLASTLLMRRRRPTR